MHGATTKFLSDSLAASLLYFICSYMSLYLEYMRIMVLKASFT